MRCAHCFHSEPIQRQPSLQGLIVWVACSLPALPHLFVLRHVFFSTFNLTDLLAMWFPAQVAFQWTTRVLTCLLQEHGKDAPEAPEPLIGQCNGDWIPALQKDHGEFCTNVVPDLEHLYRNLSRRSDLPSQSTLYIGYRTANPGINCRPTATGSAPTNGSGRPIPSLKFNNSSSPFRNDPHSLDADFLDFSICVVKKSWDLYAAIKSSPLLETPSFVWSTFSQALNEKHALRIALWKTCFQWETPCFGYFTIKNVCFLQLFLQPSSMIVGQWSITCFYSFALRHLLIAASEGQLFWSGSEGLAMLESQKAKAAAKKKAQAGRWELRKRGRLGACMAVHEVRRNALRMEGISSICMLHHIRWIWLKFS